MLYSCLVIGNAQLDGLRSSGFQRLSSILHQLQLSPDALLRSLLILFCNTVQVDFSQSVYHLWKQFRRFGRDGAAPDPNQPGGVAPGGVGGHDKLELKVCFASVHSL